jgi:hypothetical protein
LKLHHLEGSERDRWLMLDDGKEAGVLMRNKKGGLGIFAKLFWQAAFTAIWRLARWDVILSAEVWF